MGNTRRIAPALTAVLLAAIVQAVPPAGAAPSYLDPTFGMGGVVTLGGGVADATALAAQPDGRILVGGRTALTPPLLDENATVTRLLPNGAVDPTFGAAGVFTFDDGGLSSRVTSLVPQTNGLILASIWDYDRAAGNVRVNLLRLDDAGHVDAGFGEDGVVQGTPGANLHASDAALALQPDGKILLTGTTEKGPPHEFDMSVSRFNPDGSPDSRFGDAGVASADFSSPTVPRNDFATGIALLPGGRIVIGGPSDIDIGGGASSDGFALAAFTASGIPDAGFGTSGHVFTTIPHPAPSGSYVQRLAVQPDGKLVAAGAVYGLDGNGFQSAPRFAFARYTSSGSLDPGFGTAGTTLVGAPPLASDSLPSSLAINSAGEIIAGGGRSSPATGDNDFAVVRLLPNGMPDASFGGSGSVVTRLTAGSELIQGIGLQPDGGIVAAGGSDLGPASVVRYRSSSGVSAWGWNPVGELGTGTNSDSDVPVAAPSLYGADAVAAGAYHGLVSKGDGSVWAWGWNAVGQLGDGMTSDRWSPVPVLGLTGVTAVAAGGYHSLAAGGDDGLLWAWGWNGLGQLGDGTTTDRHQPVEVPLPGTRVVSVAAGAFHSLALDADGKVWAWGWNGAGQLGDGTTTDQLAPVPVPGLTGVVAVAAGAYDSLALEADGSVWAWGWNGAGQLGDGTTTDRHQPVPVTGLSGVAAISGGGYHSLAVKSDGTVVAWGWNVVGQLGDGTTTDRHTPVAVLGLTGVATASAGAFHSVALGTGGRVWAWGWNGVGQLGDGTTTDRHTPVAVLGLADATAVAAGLAETLTVRP